MKLGGGASDALPLPDKPSIAVLAFTNMSGDLDQEYFSDGIADDIITELSRCRSLFVIARNSSFAYKGGSPDVRRVGRELGVRYVVQGSVRRGGERVRLSAQLIDAAKGDHVWSERYDRELTDIFALQDDITRAMVQAIGPAISQAERQRAMQKAPENLSAWEAYHRSLSHWSKGGDLTSRNFLQQSVTLDPSFAAAHAMLGSRYLSETSLGAGLPIPESVKLAEVEARIALGLDPDSAIAHATLAWVFIFQGDLGPALDEAEAAITLNPNDPQGHLIKGRIFVFSGQPADAQEPLATAFRLDPRGPTAPAVMAHRVMACYFDGDYSATEAMARRAIRAYPDHPIAYRWLAAALGKLGRADEAQAPLAKVIAVWPMTIDFFVRARAPWVRPEDHEHMLDGLRKAGWRG
jgi:adenylate cyclase